MVECVGQSGGLALFCDNSIDIQVIHSDLNFINVSIMVVRFDKWHLTGFYGVPDCNRRPGS